MNVIDAGIIGVIALGLLLGWSRGMIGPLLAEAGFLVSLWIVITHPALLDALVPPSIPRPLAMVALPGVIGLVVGIMGRSLLGTAFRLPLARQVDRLLGAAVHGALAGVIVYVVLVGMAGAERVLAPISGVAAIHPVPLTALGQYAQALAWYERELRPQFQGSRLAPVVLRLGAHLPVIGRPA